MIFKRSCEFSVRSLTLNILEILPQYIFEVHYRSKMILEIFEEIIHAKHAHTYIFTYFYNKSERNSKK